MEDFIFFLLLILVICVVLYIDYLLAKEFYKVAVMKGYSEKKYLWISFLFLMIGYLLVIALPAKVSEKKPIDEDELPVL